MTNLWELPEQWLTEEDDNALPVNFEADPGEQRDDEVEAA